MATPAVAAEAAPSVELKEVSTERNQVLVVVAGDSHTASNLASVLLPRLMDESAELRFESVTHLSSTRLRALLANRNARFVVVLDAEDSERWLLTIIDPTSDRAMARSLAGTAIDQAALEATVSVIVSANQALTAGESIGDLSVDAALVSRGVDDVATAGDKRSPVETTPQAPHPAHAAKELRTKDIDPSEFGLELALAILGEPLAQPGGYGVDWTVAFGVRGPRVNVYAGPSFTMGFPTTVPTVLGHSEFHWLQAGVNVGLLLVLDPYLEVGLTLEPFGERVQARHRPNVSFVLPRDTPAGWGLACRAALSGHFWLLPSLGLEATTGIVSRANAPIYVDSLNQTLLTTTPTGWFVQAGALFRFVP